MPELPEVETVRRGLGPVLEGARIRHVELRRPDLRWPLPERMSERLAGARVGALGRRAKYLLAPLSTGETLIVHLGMSGRMLIERPGTRIATARLAHPGGRIRDHDHVVLETEAGVRVVFNDARRFGAMDLWPSARIDTHPWLLRLGPEPLGNAFSAAHLADAFRGRRAAVKTLLLDQRIVAGLGNIYVCEALHRAGIAPTRAAGRISRARLERLVAAIRDVLAEAIEAGGTSLRDHRRPDGELGYFQHAFRVYGREGARCPTPGCGGTIRRFAQGGRSSWACPRCQR